MGLGRAFDFRKSRGVSDLVLGCRRIFDFKQLLVLRICFAKVFD